MRQTNRPLATTDVLRSLPVRRLRRAAIWLLGAAATVPLFFWLTSLASGAEPRLTPVSSAGPSSLKWRSAGQASMTTSLTPRLAIPHRDDAIRPVQAVGAAPPAAGATNPLSDPFNDRGAAPPRLLDAPATTVESQPTPAAPILPSAPALAPTTPAIPTTPALPGPDQYAAGNSQFKSEECPKFTDLKPIRDITNRIAASQGDLPNECYFDESVVGPSNRAWAQTTYMWKSSGMCHKPLYFEQAALERYGHSTGRWSQPLVNGAHFFATVPLLPYKMGINPPWECQYALGYYRPGSCAPYNIPPVPLSARGAAMEAGTVLGLLYVLP